MSFPEEPLDLPPSEGGGYYPAKIHQTLNGGKFEVVRKLGYGPRSSTWLVWDTEHYFAIKIYTIAASEHAKTVELPILKVVDDLPASLRVPAYHSKFWQRTSAGSHLCLVLNPMSTTVQALQHNADHERLPVHVVQFIVRIVADALEGLHRVAIMHGAVKPENVYFWTPTQAEYLTPVLESEPSPITRIIGEYWAVISQPLAHGFKWNDKRKKVADWGLYLDGFGHAQQSNYEPEKKVDYSLAPETLLQSASCSPQTDIWMLGYMTFYLLTGTPPFFAKPTISKTIAHLSGALGESIDSTPPSWLSDAKMKDYHTITSGDSYASFIETSLADVLHEDDVVGAAAFIKGCLRLDPEKRLSAKEASGHEWLSKASACSCGFCM